MVFPRVLHRPLPLVLISVAVMGCTEGVGPRPPSGSLPTLAQLAPRAYVFRKNSSRIQCASTITTSDRSAFTGLIGPPQHLELVTNFGQVTSAVVGPYIAEFGVYDAAGNDGAGNNHWLNGVWSLNPDGDPRFAGTLIEEQFNPRCTNTFAVTYTVD